MVRGTDRRHLRAAHDDALVLTTRLIAGMMRDPSPAGQRFAAALVGLSTRWSRLLRTLEATPGATRGGPTGIAHVAQYLALASVGPPVWYPPPRDLTDEEVAEVERRRAAIQPLRDECWTAVQARYLASDPEAMEEWNTFDQTAHELTFGEVWRSANPGRKQRSSRRLAVRRFIAEVEDFCTTWRLTAPWALPVVVFTLFLTVRLLIALALDLFVGRAREIPRWTFVVQLPRTADQQFAADRPLAAVRWQATLDEGTSRPIQVLWRPTREELEALERGGDAACVVMDWDGRPAYPSRWDSRRSVDFATRLIEECEARMSGPLQERERRWLRSQIEPQMQEARRQLLADGFVAAGGADEDMHVAWLARRLLDPLTSYAAITEMSPLPHRCGGIELPDPSSVRRACARLAERIGLAPEVLSPPR